MKARQSKSKVDAKKPTDQTKAQISNFSSPGSIQTKADSAPADYSSPIYRPRALSNNVSRTLQKRSMSSVNGGKTSIYPKMTVNAPNDRYEREADDMARDVVQRIQRAPQSAEANTQSNSEQKQEKRPKTIQRQANPNIVFSDKEFNFNSAAGQHLAAHETVHNAVQQGSGGTHPSSQVDLGKAPDIDPSTEALIKNNQGQSGIQRKSAVQREFDDGGMEASPELETTINQESGKGQPLPEDIGAKMGDAFGEDFSHVRVHTDSKAKELNQAVNAKAFTTGADIFFNQGAYNPNSKSGQELIAHELTHVVQQGG